MKTNFDHIRIGASSLALAALAGTVLFSKASAVTALPPADVAHLKTAEAIPWSQIGAKAGADYKGDGLTVTRTESGARLRCVFQKLEGEATREGLWLSSTDGNTAKDRFRVMASSVGRTTDGTFNAQHLTLNTELGADGDVSIDGQTVRFTRPGLVEEYTVSMDGVRQDFVVLEKPATPINSQLSAINPSCELRVELSVTGARAEAMADGARLVLNGSGRKIAYNRLRVTDATGRELSARMEVLHTSEIRNQKSEMRLAVLVNDTDAVYPVRIDPTFSDANWISMGGFPGANGVVRAAVVDSSDNLYIGGGFTTVGNTFVNNIAKWNGNGWANLGSGFGEVYALAVSGNELYAGGLRACLKNEIKPFPVESA